MFTCKPENRVGVYMLISKKTADTYVGATSNLPSRLQSYEYRADSDTWGHAPKTSALWNRAFPSAIHIEFRILEFVKVELSDKHRGGITRESKRRLMNREKFWIAKLNPTLNRRIERAKRHIEDLPIGAPEMVAHVAK